MTCIYRLGGDIHILFQWRSSYQLDIKMLNKSFIDFFSCPERINDFLEPADQGINHPTSLPLDFRGRPKGFEVGHFMQ